jgi:hypothetical protein
MTDTFSGFRTRIQTEIPEAYYVHCYAHCLNLAVVQPVHFVWWVIDTLHLGECFANE